MKPTFGAKSVQAKRQEKLVVWVRKTSSGEDYLSIKINDPSGKPINIRAFKRKKTSELAPDFVGYED